MPKLFAICIFLLFSNQDHDKNLIKWQDRQALTWKDFKSSVDKSSLYGALTTSGMRYSFGMRQEGEEITLSFDVFSYFHKSSSWVKKDKASDYLLAHEQVHFDIAEIYAQKLHVAFSKYRYKKSFQKDVEGIFQKYVREMEKYQKKYDDESDHSKNKEGQAKWTKKVTDLLKIKK